VPAKQGSPTPLSPYQLKLFVFLSVATFFEGYDFLALAQLLPDIRASMGLTPAQGGALVAVINSGTVLAYLLVRKADSWGRKRVMSLTIAGYTLASFASGLAPNVYAFAGLQLLARIFLIGEWAVAMVYAAEEYPADRRGMVIGVIQGCSSLGSVACAALVPFLVKAPWGWRTVYFVGALPLVILAVARRGLRETDRFVQASAGGRPAAQPFARILRTPYRKRVLQLALIWGLTYVCTQTGITFWKEFAMGERAMTAKQVGGSVAIAAVASMPLVFAAGKLIDWAGRRRGAVLIFTLASIGVWGAYTFETPVALVAALALAIFGASAVLPVLNAYTAELFPTELRSDAFAWSNNLLGRIGYVLSPLAVGLVATEMGWGRAVAATAVFPLIALALIWALLPETSGRDLEDTSAVG
jgi:MFS transporter, putative metabolite:H+ symporter